MHSKRRLRLKKVHDPADINISDPIFYLPKDKFILKPGDQRQLWSNVNCASQDRQTDY